MSNKRIRWLIKKREVKTKIVNKWYSIGESVADIIYKLYEIKDKLEEKKIKSIKIEKATKHLTKAIINDLVRHSQIKDYEIELEVATKTNEMCGESILEYLKHFSDNKIIKMWSSSIPTEYRCSYCKTIAERFVSEEAEKYGLHTEMFIRDWGIFTYKIPEDYQYTLRVKLK